MTTLAVVGGGLAGLRSLQVLRGQGFGGRVVVVSDEPAPPYDRTLLSKALLAGTSAPGAELLMDAASVAALGGKWVVGRRAVRLRTDPRVVELDDGTEIPADGVVVATGSRARELPALSGAYVLRTMADCERLRSALGTGRRLLVVGAGLVGGEVAATAAALGHTVTVVEADAEPFVRQFGALVAERLLAAHAGHGVQVLSGVTVVAASAGARGQTARLSNGTTLPADVVLVGVGALPNVEWLAGSGVDVDDGVVTDAAGRTSVLGVVAVGDVARYASPTYGSLRVEHWTNARDMPDVAVPALLAQLGAAGERDDPLPYDPVPYFWSTQYGHHIQLAGMPGIGDGAEVVDGDVAKGPFAAVETRGGTPVAAMAWDSPRAFNRLRRTLRAARTAP